MVQTRRQWNAWRDEGFEEEKECEECERESGGGNDHDFDAGPSTYEERRDPCNRHRPRDDEPYMMNVTAYKRRKPNR